MSLTLRMLRGFTGSGGLAIVGGITIATLFAATAAIAQTIPADVPSDASGDGELIIPNPDQEVTPLPEQVPTPPPDPYLQSPPTPEPSSPPSNTSEIRFPVRDIQVLGATVLQDEIEALVAPSENRELTFEDLIALRSAITQLYIDNGYITSGAFLLNNQDLSSGVVQIQVVEGELERIDLAGLDHLQEAYVRSRLNLAATVPLNQQRLEQALQLLQLNPLLQQVNAELTAGSAPGLNVLQVQLQEAPAVHAGLLLDDYQASSIGSEQLTVVASHDNLLGWGDRLAGQYSFTRGLNLYDIGYSIPFNPYDGTLSVSYGNTDSRIIEDAFADLDIESATETLSFGVRQPLQRSPASEFALGLTFDLRRNRTYILDDIPFSFSEGAENGVSKVAVLRFSQDWVRRTNREVLAARSQFSFGIEAFDATVNDIGTDGRFFSWLGQFQWVRQVSARNLLVTRLNAQLTPDSLLSLERLSLGGVDTVRGYPQNLLVADNGIFGSIEMRIPLLRDPNRLQIMPFLEGGHVWNNVTPDPDPDTIASIGLGARWQITPTLSFRVDYGIPLIDFDNQGNSLQDNGLYLLLRYQPL